MEEEVEAIQVPVTFATFEGDGYMYHPHIGMWYIFHHKLGWVFPTKDQTDNIQRLDYMVFNDEEKLH